MKFHPFKTKEQIVRSMPDFERKILPLIEKAHGADKLGMQLRYRRSLSVHRYWNICKEETAAIENTLVDSFRSGPPAAIVKPNGELFEANPAALELFGISEKDAGKILKGFNLHKVPLIEDMLQMVKNGQPVIFEREILPDRLNALGIPTAFDHAITLEVKISKIKSTNGPAGFVIHLTDITAYKKSELALQETHDLFSKLSSQLPGMIYQFRMDSEGNFSVPFTSDAIRGIFGCSPEEVRNDFAAISRAILPEDLGAVVASIKESAKSMSIWECEYRVQLPGKGVAWMYGHSKPEQQPDGSIVWNGYNADITRLKEIESALNHTISEKDKFASVIGHDLKNPIGAIIGFSGILIDDYRDYGDMERIELIQRINTAGQNALALLENIVEYSRVHAGKYNAPPKALSPRALVDEEISRLMAQAEKKGVGIYNVIKPDLQVSANELLLERIFQNLLTNAIKFSNRGGKIVVSATKRSDGMVEVKVTDNGVGISQDRIPHLFKVCPENISTPGTAKEKGTGFGLPLVADMVKMNGGEIWVETRTGANSGSAFHFTLPAV